MFGAVLGDIIGSRFEFDRGGRTKEFTLFTKEDDFTDDTVMTVAIMEGLIHAGKDADEKTVKESLIRSMQKWGRKYPYAGYGARFIHWIHAENPQPYNSWGNGSAMRVSSVGWLYDSLERTREAARWSAEISHNHPEGVKGAECAAAVIYLARAGEEKEGIRDYVLKEFGYDLSETMEELRARHEHVESCQDSLPKALTSFFEGISYEDVVRNAVSLGGDTDTLGAIAGAMAEAYYGIPEDIINEGKNFLPEEMLSVLMKIDTAKPATKKAEQIQKVKQLREQGLTYREIGTVMNISAAYAHILDKPELYNTEKHKEMHKKYIDKRREENLAYGKKWREKHPEYMKEWYQANKERYKEYQRKKKENETV
ncbi:MAG: ADP-ribosylglycohydrolase family protein [Erysipelotrichaceae bacterium]|nr:ADP-ribosylglycohydrolase family protein [Erysipelotrichaceae bacterium]